MRGTWALVVLFVALAFCATTQAQESQQKLVIAQKIIDGQSSTPKRNDPHPEDPIKAVLAAFDKCEVVGMGAGHGNKDLDDLILRLVRDRAFPDKVNDVSSSAAIHVINPFSTVTSQEVAQPTQPMCSTSGFYEILGRDS